VDAQVVAKASKDKDVNYVQKHYRETTASKLLPALCIVDGSDREEESVVNTSGFGLKTEGLFSSSSVQLDSSHCKSSKVSNSRCSSSVACVTKSCNDDDRRDVRSVHSSYKRHRKHVESSSSCSSDDDFVPRDKKKRKPKGFSFNMWF
jgi:hypothetical protein